MDPISKFLFTYFSNGLIVFLVIAGILALMDYIEASYPNLSKSNVHMSAFTAFKASLAWPITLVIVIYVIVIKPLFKKKKV